MKTQLLQKTINIYISTNNKARLKFIEENLKSQNNILNPNPYKTNEINGVYSNWIISPTLIDLIISNEITHKIHFIKDYSISSNIIPAILHQKEELLIELFCIYKDEPILIGSTNKELHHLEEVNPNLPLSKYQNKIFLENEVLLKTDVFIQLIEREKKILELLNYINNKQRFNITQYKLSSSELKELEEALEYKGLKKYNFDTKKLKELVSEIRKENQLQNSFQRHKKHKNLGSSFLFSAIGLISMIGLMLLFLFGVAQKEQAIKSQVITQKAQQHTLDALQKATIAEKKATENSNKAKTAEKEALLQKQKAQKEAYQARLLLDIAQKAQKKAKTEKQLADSAKQRANKLSRLSFGKSLASQSLLIESPKDKATVALQAYLFTKENNPHNTQLVKNDALTYEALFKSALLNWPELFNPIILDGNTRLIFEEPNSRKCYFLTSKGSLYKGIERLNIPQLKNKVHKAGTIINNKLFLCGDYNEVLILELSSLVVQTIQYPLPTTGVFMNKTKNNQVVICGQHNNIFLINDKGIKIIKQMNQKITATNIIESNLWLGTKLGDLYKISLNTQTSTDHIHHLDSPIYSLTNNHDKIFIGLENGELRTFNYLTNKELNTIKKHKSRINKLLFIEKTNTLVSAGFDKKIYLWNTKIINSTPIKIENHQDWIWTGFAQESSLTLYAGCKDGKVFSWPLTCFQLAQIHIQKHIKQPNKQLWNTVSNQAGFSPIAIK